MTQTTKNIINRLLIVTVFVIAGGCSAARGNIVDTAVVETMNFTWASAP